MNAQHCGIHIGAQTERNLIKANHIIAEKSIGIRLQGDANTTISNRIEGYTQATLENTGQENIIRFNRIEISARD